MKTDKALDHEIKAVSDFVNSFPKYDPANVAQAKGFLVLEALKWARGKRVEYPSLMLRAAKEREG